MTPEAIAGLSKLGGFGLAVLVTFLFGRYLLQRIAKLEADNDKLTNELTNTAQSINTLSSWLKENHQRDQDRWTSRELDDADWKRVRNREDRR